MLDIAALTLLVASFMEVKPPEQPPQIKIVPHEEIATLVCSNPSLCKDIFFFYAHKESTIFVAKGVDFKYTFSTAELIREIGRHILYEHKIYKPGNTCATNTALEVSLMDMEMDYIKYQKKKNAYVMHAAGGVPIKTSDLGKRIWFCDPKAKTDAKSINI